MRYVFVFSDQAVAPGEFIEFSSPERMRREARRALLEIAMDDAQADDNIELSVCVRDEDGAEAYNICLSLKRNAPAH